MPTADPKNLYIVGLDGDEDESHPLWDERTSMPVPETLVRSIMVYGNKVEVIVREAEVNGAKRLEVVDGRQRVKASRVANDRLLAADQLPLEVKYRLETDANDAIMASSIMNLTNAVRFQDDPITESEKTLRYVQRLRGKDEDPVVTNKLVSSEQLEVAATVFGVSSQTIRNRLKFCTLDPVVQRLVRAGKLGFTHAFNLADLPREQQIQKAVEVADTGATIEETKAKVRATKTKEEIDQKKASPLGVVLLRKVLALAKDDGKACKIPDTAMLTLKVVTGELPVTHLQGLPELINRVEAGERPEKGLVKKRKEG